ncbi:hypothetical protein DCE93_12650 [Agromyces badenianii]|uniref:Uncharacterized protein n=2 Tax=Agromyces badenianii TaxID=2080742 RepID=A0A2S0WYL5_9MICO|nr:hypothetical protein DCE93_12650 [Agromyces badenianii]
MSVARRTVTTMTKQMQHNAPHLVIDEPCPRCDSLAVRAIVYGPLDFEVEATVAPSAVALDDAPIFDCRECGFEWGAAVRDLLA